jgi:putative phosphoesterase
MLLGIHSDTHNHSANLLKALAIFRSAGIDTLIHCGDLTDIDMAVHLAEFPVIFTPGNGDWNAAEIRRMLAFYAPANVCTPIYEGKFGISSIAATHGHLPGALDRLVSCGEFDYVFHGHSHRRQDERRGRTRIINPGALGGTHFEARSIALLDLDCDVLSFQNVE